MFPVTSIQTELTITGGDYLSFPCMVTGFQSSMVNWNSVGKAVFLTHGICASENVADFLPGIQPPFFGALSVRNQREHKTEACSLLCHSGPVQTTVPCIHWKWWKGEWALVPPPISAWSLGNLQGVTMWRKWPGIHTLPMFGNAPFQTLLITGWESSYLGMYTWIFFRIFKISGRVFIPVSGLFQYQCHFGTWILFCSELWHFPGLLFPVGCSFWKDEVAVFHRAYFSLFIKDPPSFKLIGLRDPVLWAPEQGALFLSALLPMGEKSMLSPGQRSQ